MDMSLVDKHGADPVVTTKGAAESYIQHRMLHNEHSSFFYTDLLGWGAPLCGGQRKLAGVSSYLPKYGSWDSSHLAPSSFVSQVLSSLAEDMNIASYVIKIYKLSSHVPELHIFFFFLMKF